MPLTLPSAWEEAFDSDATPVWVAIVELGVRAYFTVHDYAAGSGDTASIQHTPDGGSTTTYTITEGVDFDAVDSDAQTAANMAKAWRAGLPAGVLCYSLGSLVTFISPDGDTYGTRSSSDANAWTGTPSPTEFGTFGMCSGHVPIFGYQPVIAKVGKISVDFDPVTRKLPRPEKMRMVLSDGGTGDFWRNASVINPDLRGKQVTIKLGWAEATSESDFVTVGRYTIRNFYVAGNSPEISLVLEDASMVLLDALVTPEVIQRSHLEAIKEVFDLCGLSSIDYNATSLDPSQHSDIGHFCTGWHPYRNSDLGAVEIKPRKGVDLVNDLLGLLDGTFLPDETNRYSFLRRTYPVSAADYELRAETDYRDLTFQPLGGLTDEVVINGTFDVDGIKALAHQADENSRHRSGVPGVGGRPKVAEINTLWPSRYANIGGSNNTISATAGAGTLLSLFGAPWNGFAGTRSATAPSPATAPGAWTQDTNTNLSSSRLAYFLFLNISTGSREVIAFDQVTAVQIPDSVTGSWLLATFRVAARAQFGTTARAWPVPESEMLIDDETPWQERATLVFDVTDAATAADRKLTRLASGMHEVTFTTSLRRLDMQLGETVSFPEATHFVDVGVDGYDPSNYPVYELVRKEIGRDGIDWKAALAGYVNQTVYNTVPVGPTFTARIPSLRNLYSLGLDGTNDSAAAASFTTFDGSTRVAIAGWFRSVGSLADARHLFDADQQIEVEAGVPGTHTNRSEVRVTLNNGAYAETTTDGPILDDIWHHVVVLYEGSGSALGVYINGRKRATTASGTHPATITDRSGAAEVRIGADQAAANGTQWPGRIDELAVFEGASAAYDSADVARWFNTGQPPQLHTEPVHWWRFENSFRDARGGAHLTPDGAPFFHGDVPDGLWSLTYSGDFDGSNDYVDYGDVTDLDLATSATWSFWVYQPSLDAGRVLHRMGNTGGGFRISINSVGNVECILRNTGTNASETTTGAPITASSWHHVAIVYASSAITIYVDGSSAASTTFSTLPSAIEAPTPSGTLRVNESGGSSTSLAAYLSNLAFWAGTAASAAQVAEIYNSGVPPDLNELPTLGDPDWWVTADGVWTPRNHASTPTPAGGVGFIDEVP